MSKLYQSMEPVWFTPPPTKTDKRLWKDAPSPPPPDPHLYDVLDKQVGLSQQTLDFTKQAYAENQVRQQALDKMNMDIGTSQLQDAATNRARSADQYDFYKRVGQPAQEKAITEAQNYDSAGNIAAFKGRAAADVNASYGQIEGEQARTLSRFGVMPNANRLASINAQLEAQKAGASAGAQTNAEMGVRNQAIGMRQQAANIASGVPATSMQFGQQAQNGQQAAFGNNLATNNANMATQQQANSGFGVAGSALNGAASTGMGIYNGQLNAYGQQMQANSANSAGFGSLIGMGLSNPAITAMLADGGEIKGPGNGVSDSVQAVNTSNGAPVRLSNGEFVVPADVVRHYGTEHFKKMIEKVHTPAAIQRKRTQP